MNSLKGLGAVATLGAIAVAVKLAADVRYFVVAVTIVLLITSSFTYVASGKRSRNDRETAELSGLTRVMTWDGILPTTAPGQPGSRRRSQSALAPVLVVIVLVVGVGYAGWNFLRPVYADTDPEAAATAAPLNSQAAPNAGTRSASPADTFFDNFHYSGHDDPALAAHGWQVRSGAGGPGIPDTWESDGVSFPQDKTAEGGQALQLRIKTDGTKPGTRQAQLATTKDVFFRGTLAARVFFIDKPATGRDGDHINQAFCTISSSPASALYSELDFEYQPNGGWGAPGPKTDMVSWRSQLQGDRATKDHQGSLAGWHTLMMTVTDEKVTYSVDGRKLFTSSGKSVPRDRMRVMFNTWLIDLPFTGARAWNMRVNWVYAKADQAVSAKQVQKAVNQLYANGVNHVNTISTS